MTNHRADDILELLDNALQTPAGNHTGFGQPVADAKCWKCRRNPAYPAGQLCIGCRAYLNCETDEDPAAAVDDEVPAWFECWWATIDLDDDDEPMPRVAKVHAILYRRARQRMIVWASAAPNVPEA